MLTLSEQAAQAGERRFFAMMALASLGVVFAGFATSYYLWPLSGATHYPAGQPITPSLPLLVHAHAVLFSGWVGLLVVQAGLVSLDNVRIHRRLGRVGAGLMIVMVLTGLLTAVRARWLSLGVGVGVLATFPLRIVIGTSALWRTFAAWIVQ